MAHREATKPIISGNPAGPAAVTVDEDEETRGPKHIAGSLTLVSARIHNRTLIGKRANARDRLNSTSTWIARILLCAVVVPGLRMASLNGVGYGLTVATHVPAEHFPSRRGEGF